MWTGIIFEFLPVMAYFGPKKAFVPRFEEQNLAECSFIHLVEFKPILPVLEIAMPLIRWPETRLINRSPPAFASQILVHAYISRKWTACFRPFTRSLTLHMSNPHTINKYNQKTKYCINSYPTDPDFPIPHTSINRHHVTGANTVAVTMPRINKKLQGFDETFQQNNDNGNSDRRILLWYWGIFYARQSWMSHCIGTWGRVKAKLDTRIM